MSTTDIIALSTCIATWLYVILVFITLIYVRKQLDEQKKSRKFQETISIFKEVQAKELDGPRRYIHEDVTESIKGIESEKLWEYVHKIEPAIINLDRVGYLVRRKHIDETMITETYWPEVWRCWKKTSHLIQWIREQRNEMGAYREYEYLFNLSEAYRIQNGLPEPRFYRVKTIIQTE